jgi:hypothetical protein
MVKLFNVNLPQITKWELKERLANLNNEYNEKLSLYWYYSEFLLRANRNPWYKRVLNEAGRYITITIWAKNCLFTNCG